MITNYDTSKQARDAVEDTNMQTRIDKRENTDSGPENKEYYRCKHTKSRDPRYAAACYILHQSKAMISSVHETECEHTHFIHFK